MAFIAMQMASTLRASKSERKRGSRREKERSSGSRVNEREITGDAAVAAAAAAVVVAACACTRFFLRPFGLCITAPFPPVVHAHVCTIDQSSMCAASFSLECEYARARACVCRRDCVQRA